MIQSCPNIDISLNKAASLYINCKEFPKLTIWQAERHFYHSRFTGAATILSFGHSVFTSLDSIGSAVGKCPIGHAVATREWPTEY